MRCHICQKLTIEGLVELAKTEFTTSAFPKHASFQHRASLTDLEDSARLGCDLCEFIRDALAKDIFPSGSSKPLSALEQRTGSRVAVKICINTNHAWNLFSLSQVDMLETLILQVGGGLEGDGAFLAEPGDDDDEVPSLSYGWPLFLKFTLTRPRGYHMQLGRHTIAHASVDENRGSAANFAMARNWIETCRNEHTNCRSSSSLDPVLPTRVLDVGDPSTRQGEARLFVSRGTRAKYVALSHCWGKQPILAQLKTGNLRDLESVIPRDTLPPNFRDAVDICRGLGVRYLWIDSLCIIQDSASDWAKESVRMGHVYRDALVTVCAISSPGAYHGIISAQPRRDQPQSAAIQIPVSVSSNDYVTASVFSQNDQEDLWGLNIRAPLRTRGWCLQESLLSRRVLYYGVKQIYWGCAKGFKAADEVPSPQAFPNRGSGPTTLSDALNASETEPLPFTGSRLRDVPDSFYALISAYTSRRLTFDKDKLPAVSGFTQRLHPMLGGDYLAGVWSSDFRQGLLWTASEIDEPLSAPPGDYRAPSWSWAATNTRVFFQLYEWMPHMAPSVPDDLQLLDYEVIPKDPSNPYGEVLSGYLSVRGLTARLRRVHGTMPPRWGLAAEFPTLTTVIFDDPEEATWEVDRGDYLAEQADSAASGYFTAYGTSVNLPGSDRELAAAALPRRTEYLVLMVRTVCEEPGDEDSPLVSYLVDCLVLEEDASDTSGKTYRRAGQLRSAAKEDISAVCWTERALKII